MDMDRFEDIVRSFATTPSRRAVHRALAGLTVSSLLAPALGGPAREVEAKHHKHKKKKKKPPPPPSRCNTIAGFLACVEPIFGLTDCCDVFAGEECTACGCCNETDTCCGETCCPSNRQCCGSECCQTGFQCCGNVCCTADDQCCPGGGCCHQNDVCCRTGNGQQYCCAHGLSCLQEPNGNTCI
jgi:hypothetical protein